jgi:ketosteroid isomerase-like protein
MADHPDAARYRALVETFNEGDMSGFADNLTDDVEWHYIGATEPLHGRDAVMASMSEVLGDTTLQAELHDVVANDDHLVALISATATKADGSSLTYRTAEIMHVSDGKVTHRWAFADDTQAVKEFFGV